MTGYKLTVKALKDVADLISYVHSDSASRSIRIENRLFEAVLAIAREPALGHVRTDVTTAKLLFYNILRM